MVGRASMMSVLLSLVATTAWTAPEDEPTPWVDRTFVILRSTSNYEEALSFARAPSTRLQVKVDLRDLSASKTLGLTFPKDVCESEWGEYPCYLPRGRWDDGVYLSIEHSSGYKGFSPGLFIVVMANGSREDREVQAALARALAVYPDAYAKRTSVYLGCMH